MVDSVIVSSCVTARLERMMTGHMTREEMVVIVKARDVLSVQCYEFGESHQPQSI